MNTEIYDRQLKALSAALKAPSLYPEGSVTCDGLFVQLRYAPEFRADRCEVHVQMTTGDVDLDEGALTRLLIVNFDDHSEHGGCVFSRNEDSGEYWASGSIQLEIGMSVEGLAARILAKVQGLRRVWEACVSLAPEAQP